MWLQSFGNHPSRFGGGRGAAARRPLLFYAADIRLYRRLQLLLRLHQRKLYRWLDLFKFAQAMLPKNEVLCVKYFTALVKSSAKDPTKENRQQPYLRALAIIPQVEVFLGSFQAHPVTRPLANGSGSAEVIDMKEKGSDVPLVGNRPRERDPAAVTPFAIAETHARSKLQERTSTESWDSRDR